MKRVRLSTAMDRKRREHPLAVLFTVPEENDPFHQLLVKKHKSPKENKMESGGEPLL